MGVFFWVEIWPNFDLKNLPFGKRTMDTIFAKFQKSFFPKSKHHGTKPMYPFSWGAFQRHQEHNLKHHPGSVDLIPAKQNKLPSFIDRSAWRVIF
jgi:hypothetical protein